MSHVTWREGDPPEPRTQRCPDCHTEYVVMLGSAVMVQSTADVPPRYSVYVTQDGQWVHSCSLGVPDESDPNPREEST